LTAVLRSIQTDWQAKHKMRGLGRDPIARRSWRSPSTSPFT